MRKNTRTVHRAFLLHECASGGVGPNANRAAIWTDGEAIYSYSTALVVRHPEGGYVVNTTSYSVTTTIQVNGLLSVLPHDKVRTVTGLPIGVSADKLLAAGFALEIDSAEYFG